MYLDFLKMPFIFRYKLMQLRVVIKIVISCHCHSDFSFVKLFLCSHVSYRLQLFSPSLFFAYGLSLGLALRL